MPLGIIWTPGQFPSVTAGYNNKFASLRSWVLTRLVWMEGQLQQVRSSAAADKLSAAIDMTLCSLCADIAIAAALMDAAAPGLNEELLPL